MNGLIGFTFDSFQFSFEQLWIPTVTIFITGYFLINYVLRNWVISLLVAFIKCAIFFIYFYFLFDGTYTSGFDDYFYISGGNNLLILIEEKPFFEINFFEELGTFHIIYLIISALSQFLFGEFYFSLAAINVICSFLCGLISFKIIQLQFANYRYASIFSVAVMLYPDIISWTSVYAGKDIFVLLGHLVMIYASSCYLKNHIYAAGLSVIIGLIYLTFLRFYAAILFSFLIFFQNEKKVYLGFLAICLGFTVFSLELYPAFLSLYETGMADITLDVSKFLFLPVNIFHFWLTPRPFYEDSIHGFLLLANIFNWTFFPLIFFGFLVCLLSKDKFSKWIAIYFLIFSIFYGFIDYLNGPRHRLQLTFAIVYFLWIGLVKFGSLCKRNCLYPVINIKNK